MMAEQDRQALAAEVLELGEQLFALALEGRHPQQVEGTNESQEEDDVRVEEAQPFPMAEIEEASHEFFTALRLLLGVKQA